MPAEAQGSDAEARALFNAGEVAYSEGRYATALDYFRRAYEISGRVLLLYNIGNAAERVRHDEEALEAYERYLADTPEDAPNRVAVAARVEILRGVLNTPEPEPEPVAAEPEPAVETPVEQTPVILDQSRDDGPGVAPWILVGAGGAVAVAGAVLVGIGYKDAATVSDAAMGTTWSDISGAYERAPVLQGVGFALVGVGVATAVAGIVWRTMGSGDAEDRPTASMWLTPDSGGVVVGGSF